MSSPHETAQILQANHLKNLTRGFDASDVLEVYTLIRQAPLALLAKNTSTPLLTVSKPVLGIRYRPPAAYQQYHNRRDPLELTLEYGPAHTGPLLQQESIPLVQTQQSSEEQLSLNWDNQGTIYYSTRIDNSYTRAYYLGSCTGAVLEQLLQKALQYPMQRRARRYQPFSVYLKPTSTPTEQDETQPQLFKKLKSSSDADFVQHLWQTLVNVGVLLDPVVPPPLYELALVASNIKRLPITADGALQHDAAMFYQNLYRCIQTIATGESQTELNSNSTRWNHQRRRRQEEPENSKTLDNATLAPETPTVPVSPETPGDTSSTTAESVEQAQNAANAAQEAADAAQNANSTESAADAAQQAADAAQEVVDITSKTVAQAASEGLLSGDGNQMASMVSLCFSDPVHGIRTTTDGSTIAYLYFDGSFYYRLNLTAPFLQVIALERGLPEPTVNDPNNFGNTGASSSTDWFLALVIFGMFVVGFLLLIQQIFGGHVKLVRPLLKWQRWFFDPCRHDYYYEEDVDDEQQWTTNNSGRSSENMMIPLSMGGTERFYRQSIALRNGSPDMLPRGSIKDGFGLDGDLELVAAASAAFGSRAAGSSRPESPSSFAVESEEGVEGMNELDWLEEVGHMLQPARLTRDPDLVEMPNLRSSSKVAVPVGLSNGTGSGHNSELSNGGHEIKIV